MGGWWKEGGGCTLAFPSFEAGRVRERVAVVVGRFGVEGWSFGVAGAWTEVGGRLGKGSLSSVRSVFALRMDVVWGAGRSCWWWWQRSSVNDIGLIHILFPHRTTSGRAWC